jgi:outer membrane receptor protein involved in Fe transport
LGNNLLLLAEPNARRIDFRLDNGALASRDGFVSATTSQIVAAGSSTNIAFYLDDDWKVSGRISVGGGLRFEHQSLRGSRRDVRDNVDFDNNPLTLYDNRSEQLLATSTPLRNDANRLSGTAGIVYKMIPDRLTLHARFNHGSNLPSFEKLRTGGPLHQSAEVLEGGADLAAGPVRASMNAFVNRFTGLQFISLVEQPDGTVASVVRIGGARAAGVEMEADVKPIKGWEIEFRGTYEEGRYRGFGGNSGNRVVRQPNLQFALSPSYTRRLGSAAVKLSATYSYVGPRYSDVENLQRLPSYATVDAGLHAQLSDGLYADLVAQNLFNEFGLTEGNTRAFGAALSSGLVIARPLFGRNVSFSLGYRF